MTPEEQGAFRRSRRCDLCGRTGRRMVIDHDHADGEPRAQTPIRGLLCVGCNIKLGYLEAFLRGSEWQDRAMKYLRRGKDSGDSLLSDPETLT